MRSRSLMTKEIPSKSGAAPKRFDRPWALSIGGKYFRIPLQWLY